MALCIQRHLNYLSKTAFIILRDIPSKSAVLSTVYVKLHNEKRTMISSGKKSVCEVQNILKNSRQLSTNESQQNAGNKKKTLEGGVVVEDVTVGSGSVAKSGKTVTVYYSGKLKPSSKVFDELKEGSGLSFRLGRGEVIDGWDVGVAGMKVGGKRIITCPPSMAYGAKGYPPVIPPNSTLVFEVDLKNVE